MKHIYSLGSALLNPALLSSALLGAVLFLASTTKAEPHAITPAQPSLYQTITSSALCQTALVWAPLTLSCNSILLILTHRLFESKQRSIYANWAITLPVATLITQALYYTAQGAHASYNITQSGLSKVYDYVKKKMAAPTEKIPSECND